ncbi:MAG: S8 family serine peptidase, partial [Phycisphaerales bacterium]
MSRAELSAAAAEVIAGPKAHAVVSFNRPLADVEKADLASSGLTLLAYLGGNNWTAVVDANADAAALTANGAMINFRAIDPQWKLETSLAQGNPPEWTIIDDGADPHHDAERPIVVVDDKTDPLVAVYINFHNDVSLTRSARAILNDLQIEARSYVESTKLVVAHARLSQIRDLIQHDEVLWVEPAEPAWTDLNNSNRLRTQAGEVQEAPYSLTGAGVNVMVYDGGTIRASHETFRGESGQRVTIGDTDSVSDHATHVAGTVAGRGQANGNHRGMAPDAHIVSYGFEVPGGLQQGFLYTDPGDLNADYSEAINTFGAHLSNNSIGSNTAPNGFPCVWEGDYGNTGALIDTIARGSLGRNMIMIWAAGNERQGSARCGNSYGTTAPPGNAKNHITVGAMNSNDDSITSFTSFGPDDAGRMRPDISAPGCQNGPDATGPNDSGVFSSGSASDTDYDDKCGTSMAAPTVAGCVALMLQDWRLQFSGEPDPLPSTVKALLAHNAEDIAQPGPDNRTGYGSIRVKDTIDHMRTGNFSQSEVSQGGQYSVLVYVAPGEPEFKATIAWDDAPASPFASPTLINNLDLVVIDPNGNRQFPWTLNPANPGADAVRTQVNTLDNIEQVYVPNPTPGVWQVNVVGTNVPVGPQTVSLVASPLLVNCSTAGVAGLDTNIYPCGAELALRVSDCDLNMDDNTVETVVVLVTSDSDPVGEMVLLTETGPLTADFRASLPTSNVDSAGVLRTLDGDTITLTYLDADDGFGNTNVTVTATATVDCSAPMISDLAADPGTFDAVVSLNTNEPARVTINYGESCSNLDRSVTGPLGTEHELTLGALSDGTSYFYNVSAIDPAGNDVFLDNGGACFSFVTEDIPTYFVEQFSSGQPDLNNVQLSFTPSAGSIDFYAGCAQELMAFEIDPAGGTVLPLTTNDSQLVTLTGGASVSLYGESYTSFWVNAPGNITFDSADSDSTESITDHFSQIRVSGFYDGLDSGAGTVSWKQTANAVAITWQNVEDNFSNNTNLTFQIVMHFDGRIDLNYLSMVANDGLVGLSAGGGEPLGFIEIDLSTLGSCGPQPPFAGSASFSIPANGEVDITLPASDDGLPMPGTLTYIVET